MGWIIDIIALGIIVLAVVFSVIHGFVRTLIEVVGFVAVVVIAMYASTPLATITYDKIIEPPMIKAAQNAVQNGEQTASDAVWSKMPSFVKNNSERFNITKESIDRQIGSAVSQESVSDTTQNVLQTVAKPVSVKILSMLYSAVIFVVLFFVVKIIAKFTNKLFSVSVVGKVNRTLGGVLGFFKGLIIATALCLVINALVSMTGGFSVFTPDAVDASYFCTAIESVFSL